MQNVAAAVGKDSKVSSLELLEDCLAMVHMSRTNTLRNRAKEYNLLIAKRRKFAKLNSRQRVVVERQQDELDDAMFEQDAEHESIMDSFAHQYDKQQQQQMQKASPSKRSPGGGHGVGDEGGSPLFKSTSKFVPATDPHSMADTKASSLLLEFKVELLQWVDKNRTRIEDDSLRGEVADYLSEKYMSRQLDALAASRTVTKVRKEVAAAIEAFATDGALDPTMLEQKDTLLGLAKDAAIAGGAAFAPPSTTTTNSSSGAAASGARTGVAAGVVKKSVAFAVPSAPEGTSGSAQQKSSSSSGAAAVRDIKAAERDKIQQKYQEMKAASKATEANKVTEMEDNIDSIKALLSSLNKK